MIRTVKFQDARAIANIYNEYIKNSVISFETEPLSLQEMQSRIVEISAHFPYYVYEQQDGEILGYCYAHLWKERDAYKHTLMQRLIGECCRQGYHALIACITEGNEASILMHSKLGFKQVSHFEKVGFKFGRWLGVVDYELLLVP